MTPTEREAWHRNVIRAKAARAGMERALRVVIPVETELPDPIADALRRAEEAIEREKEKPGK